MRKLLTISGLTALAIAVTAQGDERLSNGRSIEGTWVRQDLAGSGSFTGLTSKFEKPQLTPLGLRAQEEQLARFKVLFPTGEKIDDAPNEAGKPYVVYDKPCPAGIFVDGAQGVAPDSGPIHVVVAKDQVIMSPERSGSRVIYIDGREHPPLSNLTPRASGHGIGRFEQGVLVADTINLPPNIFPGTPILSQATHLGERFVLSPDGERMTITYTYNDPELYLKPYSFTLHFDRAPKPSFALDEWCDAGDPAEGYSITPPKQL